MEPSYCKNPAENYNQTETKKKSMPEKAVQHRLWTFQTDIAMNRQHGQEFWLSHTHHAKQKQNVSFGI